MLVTNNHHFSILLAEAEQLVDYILILCLAKRFSTRKDKCVRGLICRQCRSVLQPPLDLGLEKLMKRTLKHSVNVKEPG
jgi:hypothetical protein